MFSFFTYFGMILMPFKKKEVLPRVFIIRKRYDHSESECYIYRVAKLGDFFVVKFTRSIEDQYYILEKDGSVRGRPDVTWLKIDCIPGLTS